MEWSVLLIVGHRLRKDPYSNHSISVRASANYMVLIFFRPPRPILYLPRWIVVLRAKDQ